MLRDYQQKAIDQLYDWFRLNKEGNPCLVLPTGSGKSHIVAALCKDALQSWPETRVLMLTHVKELIEQNAEKMRQHWPNAPLGIYSSSLRKKDLSEPITFAGIQSVRNRSKEIGHIDLCIIDECHLISHKDEGGYRTLINALLEINPRMRIIGLTATPYRLGHGYITDKPALFDALIEPVSIEELIDQGYLSTLRSKTTKAQLDTSGVHKRGGEFIEAELQAAVNNNEINSLVVDEVLNQVSDQKAWLFFCAGVAHAEAIKEHLCSRGVVAECVTGATPKAQRERILDRYKAGEIKALTNANVLTTGFDYPDIDLIVMLRPTMSPSLYVQMAGRGMRLKSHTDHCTVLDFAGVVATHGPITNVIPPAKKGEKPGDAPVKTCDQCSEIVHASVRKCTSCGFEFPISEKPIPKLAQDDIMGLDASEMRVTEWRWREHTSRASGNLMIAVSYYGALSDAPIDEYFPIFNEGFAGHKARATIKQIDHQSAACLNFFVDNDAPIEITALQIVDALNSAKPPRLIEYRKDGKFYRVIRRAWDE